MSCLNLESFPQSLAPPSVSLAATHAAYNWGTRYKNPIALSRNFVDASWWQPACHKPDLPSGFVNFMRIGQTVYDGWKRDGAVRGGGGGRTKKRSTESWGRKGVGGRRKVLESRYGTTRINILLMYESRRGYIGLRWTIRKPVSKVQGNEHENSSWENQKRPDCVAIFINRYTVSEDTCLWTDLYWFISRDIFEQIYASNRNQIIRRKK